MDHLTFAQLLGNYGEFFGAIAVVATLGYLGVQIRLNTRSSYVTRAAEATQRLGQIQETIISNNDLATLLARCRDPELADVTPAEEECIQGMAELYIKVFGGISVAHRNGEMPDDQFETFRTELRRIVERYPALKPRIRLSLDHFDVARYPMYAPIYD